MEGSGSLNYIGFIGYAVFVFIGTGLFILFTDVKEYKDAGLEKERKTAKMFGWTNITLGVMLFFANWLYRRWS